MTLASGNAVGAEEPSSLERLKGKQWLPSMLSFERADLTFIRNDSSISTHTDYRFVSC